MSHPNVPGIITLNRLHVTFANWPSVVVVTAALVGSPSALQKEHSVGKIGFTTLVTVCIKIKVMSAAWRVVI